MGFFPVMHKSQSIVFFTFGFLALVIIFFLVWGMPMLPRQDRSFNGQRAYEDILAQVAFSPRIPDSPAHANNIIYIQDQLRKAGWKSEIQDTAWKGFSIQNIIASRTDKKPEIILGAHYDSRIIADQDTGTGKNSPVPGANDGASGVAVLLELARTLAPEKLPIQIVFFDAEDNGGINGREWIMGSSAFVAQMSYLPRAVVIIDMVGDADLNIFIERNSSSDIVAEIWGQAAKLGFSDQFIQTQKYSMMDDHTPFLEAGIMAVDIIDFDYPFWHTSADTPDKVSPESLQIVGETLLEWITSQE
jgi:glutaminyl-peptide cyclotransferase